MASQTLQGRASSRWGFGMGQRQTGCFGDQHQRLLGAITVVKAERPGECDIRLRHAKSAVLCLVWAMCAGFAWGQAPPTIQAVEGLAAEAVPACQTCLREQCPEVRACMKGSLRSAAVSSLATAVAHGRVADVAYWVETAGIAVDEPLDRHGSTPLAMAAYFRGAGSLAVARYLVDQGANVNQPLRGAATSPLLTAVWKHNLPVAKLLMAHGADVNARSDRGWDVCVFAHRWSNFAVMPNLPGCCQRILHMAPEPNLSEERLRPPELQAACGSQTPSTQVIESER